MSDEKKKVTSFFKSSDVAVEGAKSWALPNVGKDEKPKDYTNAIRKPDGWVYEPPEPEEEAPKLPTLEEIEAIRQDAYDEGLAEGKAAGFEQGLAEGKEAGHQEGLAAGQEKGLAQGLEQGNGLIEEKADIWNKLIEQMHDPLRNIDEQVEQEVVKLAAQLAKAVVKTELSTNQNIILQTLKEAISALPVKTTHYEIHLNPDDLELVKEVYGEDSTADRGWKLVVEPTIERGGCEIKADTSSVSYTMEQRISEILDRFLQSNTSSN